MTDNMTILPAGQPQKLTDWKKEPELKDLKQDYLNANSAHTSQVATIDGWLDNMYMRRPMAKTTKGSSRVQPMLIRKQAEWRYAALSEPFLSSENIFDVSPVTFEDRDASDQNQLVLNHQINNRIDKQQFIDDFVRTAVDEGTVIVKTGWLYREETYKEMAPVISLTPDPAAAQVLQQIAALKEQNPAEYNEVPEEWRQALDMSIQDNIPYRGEVTGQKEVEKIRVLENRPTLEVCDFRNVVIDPSCRGDMTRAQFTIHMFESSMAELKADGRYKNLEYINAENHSVLGDPDYAPTSTGTKNFDFSDKPRKKLVVHEYWGFYDIDGSGTVSPILAAWVGNVLIRMELNPFPDKAIPFVTVPYLPVRFSTYGESDGALLADNQKIVGALTRGMIDIMAKSANSQMGIQKGALDVTQRRKYDRGEDYEFNPGTDPRNAFHMHKFNEIPNSAQILLQQQNMEAESLTGVKAFSNGISGQALGDTATGVRGALDAASKRELGILRRLSSGIIKIGRKMLSMNSEFLNDEEIIRITNAKFVKVRRDDLAGAFDLKLTISTAEEDNAKVQDLSFILQTMGPNMDFAITKMVLADIAKLKKMPDLAQRILAYEPQPDPIAQQKAQLELMLLQAQIATEQAKAAHFGAGANLQVAKVGTEAAKAKHLTSDAELKDLNFVEQESGVTQQRNLQAQGEQARAQTSLKIVEAQLDMMKQKALGGKATSPGA